MTPTSGHELAVFGSVLGAAGAGASAGGAAALDADTAAGAAGAGAAAGAAGAAASVALTSCSVMTRGGPDVMIVALNRSPERKSEILAGLPSRMIFTPRLSTSPCVKLCTPV